MRNSSPLLLSAVIAGGALIAGCTTTTRSVDIRVSTPSSTTSSSTSPSTTTPSTTTTVPIAAPPTVAPTSADTVTVTTVLGASVDGVPIVAERYGTEGGRKVLIVGVIHGDETDGAMIIDELRRRGEADEVPEGVELWLVESMNPDGQAADQRQNAHQVDLNRNFPKGWEPIGEPGDGQYAGTGPASEPETQAMVDFITGLQPDIAIWYHQDLYTISPSKGRSGRIRQRYSDITGIPMGEITGGHYTGIAATWASSEIKSHDGVAFIVELGATTSPEQVMSNADAVLTIAAEG